METICPYILITDDNPDDVFLLKEAFSMSGFPYSVESVSNGKEMLSLLASGREQPMLILLDINMPGLNGIEVLQVVKTFQDHRRIPVVMMSTSTSSSDIKTCYQRGANGYLVKPSNFSTLLEITETLRTYWFNTVQLPKPRS